MTREEFIKMLEDYEIPYSDGSKYVEGYDGIYVFKKDVYESIKKHPRKNKDLYCPQMRISHFGESRWYVKIGTCSYMKPLEVIDVVMEKMAH